MTKNAIEVSNLHKSYGNAEVLKGVDFEIEKGSVLALLGPNGAGKTTIVKILSTLLKADKGSARVLGYDVDVDANKVRDSIGLTGQFAAVDEYLTGRENIELVGKLYHLDSSTIKQKATKLLEQFDLTKSSDKPARTYSGGMKRKLDLAMSLVADPPILFLDEPTTGLDPRSRIGLWELIKDLVKNGKSILLTTQYMEEADYLADQIIVLDHGKIIAKGTSSELKSKIGSDIVLATFKDKKDFEKASKELNGNPDLETLSITVTAKDGVKTLKNVLNSLDKIKIEPVSASLAKPSLDDVFLTLTGKKTEEVIDTKKGGKK